MSLDTAAFEPIPALEPPPRERLGPAAWVRANLLYSPAGTLMTIVFGGAVVWALSKVARFVFVAAEWEIVRRNLALFMVGRYPREQLWRLWAAMIVVGLLLGVAGGVRARMRRAPEEDVRARTGAAMRRWWPLVAFAIVIATLVRTALPVVGIGVIAIAGLLGRAIGARLPVGWRRRVDLLAIAGVVAAFELIVRASEAGVDRFGGLLLTLTLAVVGIAASFPIGVLLALGRRSTLPAVRATSVVYIEVFRGVPLVTVLFMGDLLLGFFLPPGSQRPGAVTRALIGLIVFTSAYLAEIVRGGLQSVPEGQVEAAQALGLSRLRTIVFIVLPQALRAVIPAIVGQFISLFKDTSLVATIGLFEMLSVAQTVTKQPDFLGQGLHAETFLFTSFIFWVGAYWMSRTSQRLEQRLAVSAR